LNCKFNSAILNKLNDTTNQQGALGIIAIMFFAFGFVTWTNSMLIPYFKVACELTNFESYLVAFAFYISYLVMAIPASIVLQKIGFKKGMMLGFWVMALGAFTFIPAAYLRKYGVFLTGLFFIGIGLAFLQTAANPYVTILGAKNRAAQRISIMGICNKVAGIIAPLLLASIILKPSDADLFQQLPFMSVHLRSLALDGLIRRVILPYSCLGLFLFLLGVFVYASSLPEIDHFVEDSTKITESKPIYKYPHLILGALAIFLHVGSQVVGIDSIVNYAQSQGMSIIEAKVFPSYTLFATICGYLIGIMLMPKIISQLNIFKICSWIGLILSIFVLVFNFNIHFLGHFSGVSIWFLVLLGLANSMIWAGIWPLALDGLGNQIKLGASILIMGLCGNAIIPLIYGAIADYYDARMGYIVLIPCYLYLIFYATYGHKIYYWRKSVKLVKNYEI